MKRGAPGAQRRGAPFPHAVRTAGTLGAVAARLLDLHGSSRGRDLVHVAAGGRRASDLVRVLRSLAPELDVVAFPAWDCLPYDRASPTRLVMGRRMWALDRLVREGRRSVLVVTTPRALLQRIPPRSLLAKLGLTFQEGSSLAPDEIASELDRIGYVLDERVDEVGEAALLGQVLDVFPAGFEEPIRIEHVDGRVSGIHSYDPVSQLTTERRDEVRVLPVSEWIHSYDPVSQPTTERRDEVRVLPVSEWIDRRGSGVERRAGIEHWLPDLYGALDTFFDLVPDAIIGLDPGAEERVGAALAQIADGFEARTSLRPERGPRERPPTPERLYLSARDWERQLETRHVVAFTMGGPDDAVPVFARGARPMQEFAAFTREENEAGRRLVLTAATQRDLAAMVRRIERSRDESVRAARDWAEVLTAPREAVLALMVELDCGFRDPQTGTTVVAAPDVLGSRARYAGPEAAAPQELAGTEIEFRLGDLVLHEEHGLGLLRGLERVETQGAASDFLRLEYAGEATLLVPVEELDRIWRYGSAADRLALDRLGTAGWRKRRAKVEEEITRTARRLVAAMREREAKEAPKLVPPRQDYERFCAGFPFPETPDQFAAIEDTLAGLAAGRPMNRLVCGDVGFGKTEVALRAAAAAALAGKQVAVVAPTTVLVRQHVQTFGRRFAGLGVTVAHLSRLVSSSEAKAVKTGLADGSVRVVVGTRALAGKGIRFDDLGLVIIDEEQRFGAADKAKLGALGHNVHVLTLTATPIPRTLKAALVGLQDLSILATPPSRRQPIRTFAVPFDEVTVREALLRERRRDGQSFVVCPRVEDIEPMAARLRALVPELDLVVAHGRMPPDAIDDAMVGFADGQGDVLLATNIIESGLDVPRANTMLVWRADRFGLAQLHQLRGRVGRGRVRGIAYLLTEPGRKLASATRKRLDTLASLDRLGAGFAISAQDLDHRGAGDLFGDEQAGHVKLIGVGLYQHLLGRALASARGAPTAPDWRPELNIGVTGAIPADYVPEPEVRISLYARVAKLASEDEVDTLRDEMKNRFGPLPAPAARLIALTGVAQEARSLGVSRIDAGPQAIALTFRDEIDRATVERMIERSRGALAWRNDRLVWSWSSADEDERLANVAKVFRFLRSIDSR